MAHKIAVSTLNASTVDIMNVIRKNATLAYQNGVPLVESEHDIPRVGEVIYGTPAFSNEFINALINRIALVRVQSATFNNPYERLKKGYLDYGESVEDIFVDIAKVFEFSNEKAENRELKQYKPNVHSAFHTMNWKVIYPVSVSDEQLRTAFLSADGVTNLIAKIVDSIYTAANYDEFLLFKYMIIKAANQGAYAIKTVDGTEPKNYAKAFRGASNKLPFMSDKFNLAGVKNTTPRERQVIFMDADFNAEFDVEVLSAAFNMDKANFMGSLFLIDNWTEFDNERFEVIRENSDGIEEVTEAELDVMRNVKAILLDEEWFQIYDNLNRFAEKFVAAGLRWNYFYHTWKTVSYSPFANAILFTTASNTPADTLEFKVADLDVDENGAFVLTLMPAMDGMEGYKFVQTEALTNAGIAIHPYGAFMYDGTPRTGVTVPGATLTYKGATYRVNNTDLFNLDSGKFSSKVAVGDTVTFNKV